MDNEQNQKLWSANLKLQEENKQLRAAINYALEVGDGRIVTESDCNAVQVMYCHLDDAITAKGETP